MAIIQNIKDLLGNIIYPRTITRAVLDNEGNILDDILTNLKNKVTNLPPDTSSLLVSDDEEEFEGVDLKDADVLGGKYTAEMLDEKFKTFTNAILIFNNVKVLAADFVEDSTYSDYPYKTDIFLEGVTEKHYAEIVSLQSDENFTIFCDSFDGYISIYAKEIPTEDLILDTIFCIKENGTIGITEKPEKEVFIAKYNVTTFAEIKEAVKARKACFCKVNSADIHDSPEGVTVTGISIIILPMVGFCDGTVTASDYENIMQLVRFSHTETGSTLSVELNVEDGVERWSLEESLLPFDDYIKKSDKPIVILTDIEVLSSTFVDDTTYTEYPFKVDISCSNITENHFVRVQFSSEQILSKNYSSICNSSNGIVTIYAKQVPESNIIIPSIIGIKEV